VQIDGQRFAKVSELLLAMEMTEQVGGLSCLELRFSNVASEPMGAGFAFEDNQILKLGAAVKVYGGDETQPQELFQGYITGLEADFGEKSPPELVVLAEDAAQRARMDRRTQVYAESSVADIATQIAQRLSLAPVITALSDTRGTWVQMNESDLCFLRRLLTRFDADVQVVGSELHVSPRGDVRRGEVELILHSQLRSARLMADLAHQVNEVTITGWNSLQGQRTRSSSRGDALGPGSGQTGAEILRQTIGERQHHISHLAAPTDSEAAALAAAAFDDRARRFVSVNATAEGNPAIRLGTYTKLTGLGDRFDNTYYVVRTCHRFDVDRGYETDFEAECAFFNSGGGGR
ncbi:phage late control D family protein, partial [cf. Phormidesmis sp. LEGE 11477]|uniref:phage late control D family protein n=1 Tax=cf. Phormidesmis sp. LEGE 11477 TaxID=1828680 RepID=UPI00188261C4